MIGSGKFAAAKFSSAIPSLNDSRCWNQDVAYKMNVGSLFKGTSIVVITIAIVLANFVFIFILNSRSYSRSINSQPRYLLTCLASNDLAIGIFVSSTAILPTLFRCWPYGDIACQIQALLRGSLTRQSSMILMCLAIDRYYYTVYPSIYHKYISNNKVCLLAICTTLVTLITIFALLVLFKNGYYFNEAGNFGCDLFYHRPGLRIFSACIFYFPTTMLLMYCYGKIYNAAFTDSDGFRRNSSKNYPNGKRNHRYKNNTMTEKDSVSRTMSIISLSFTILTTPWTIYEVVAACTGYKVVSGVEFVITWFALSNSFWNPFLYWLLNGHFRKISRYLVVTKVFGKSTISTDRKMSCSNNESNNDLITIDRMSSVKEFSQNGVPHFNKMDDDLIVSGSSNFSNFCPTPPPPPHPFMISKYWRHLYQFNNNAY